MSDFESSTANDVLVLVKQAIEDLCENNAFASYHNDHVCMILKDRKTRKDVLTPFEAIRACKSSKNHKLKPKTPYVDKTRASEAKTLSKNKRFSTNKKNAAFDF
jgi:hypothetical protein